MNTYCFAATDLQSYNNRLKQQRKQDELYGKEVEDNLPIQVPHSKSAVEYSIVKFAAVSLKVGVLMSFPNSSFNEIVCHYIHCTSKFNQYLTIFLVDTSHQDLLERKDANCDEHRNVTVADGV